MILQSFTLYFQFYIRTKFAIYLRVLELYINFVFYSILKNSTSSYASLSLSKFSR